MNIATIIQYLPWLIKAGQTVPEVLAFVNQVKIDISQSGEWTPEADQAYRDSLTDLENDPGMKP